MKQNDFNPVLLTQKSEHLKLSECTTNLMFPSKLHQIIDSTQLFTAASPLLPICLKPAPLFHQDAILS